MSYVSYRWHLRRLKRNQKQIRADFAKKYKAFLKDKSKTVDDRSALEAEEQYYEQGMQERVNIFHSDRLFERATDCDIETPPFGANSDSWQYSDDGDRYFLSAHGRAQMRDLLQKEEDRNFERWARWFKIIAPVVGAFTGLIGVGIGLVAFLQHKK
jgi:hypothetical protein